MNQNDPEHKYTRFMYGLASFVLLGFVGISIIILLDGAIRHLYGLIFQ